MRRGGESAPLLASQLQRSLKGYVITALPTVQRLLKSSSVIVYQALLSLLFSFMYIYDKQRISRGVSLLVGCHPNPFWFFPSSSCLRLSVHVALQSMIVASHSHFSGCLCLHARCGAQSMLRVGCSERDQKNACPQRRCECDPRAAFHSYALSHMHRYMDIYIT